MSPGRIRASLLGIWCGTDRDADRGIRLRGGLAGDRGHGAEGAESGARSSGKGIELTGGSLVAETVRAEEREREPVTLGPRVSSWVTGETGATARD